MGRWAQSRHKGGGGIPAVGACPPDLAPGLINATIAGAAINLGLFVDTFCNPGYWMTWEQSLDGLAWGAETNAGLCSDAPLSDTALTTGGLFFRTRMSDLASCQSAWSDPPTEAT